jgi:hypothetical protein
MPSRLRNPCFIDADILTAGFSPHNKAARLSGRFHGKWSVWRGERDGHREERDGTAWLINLEKAVEPACRQAGRNLQDKQDDAIYRTSCEFIRTQSPE